MWSRMTVVVGMLLHRSFFVESKFFKFSSNFFLAIQYQWQKTK